MQKAKRGSRPGGSRLKPGKGQLAITIVSPPRYNVPETHAAAPPPPGTTREAVIARILARRTIDGRCPGIYAAEICQLCRDVVAFDGFWTAWALHSREFVCGACRRKTKDVRGELARRPNRSCESCGADLPRSQFDAGVAPLDLRALHGTRPAQRGVGVNLSQRAGEAPLHGHPVSRARAVACLRAERRRDRARHQPPGGQTGAEMSHEAAAPLPRPRRFTR
jgi:hypothetical protein